MNEPSAGRSCPLHYRYAPSVLARPPGWSCDTLYVVGGLYGNEVALQTVLSMFDAEVGPKRLIFNGDFHWFDTDPGSFKRVTEAVLSFDALRGNVETELARLTNDVGSDDIGCGCAYPDWVDDTVVQRSNRILARLRQTAQGFPALQSRLAALPMWLRVNVGALRLGVVHGDAQSLAGWGFAQEALQDTAHRHTVRGWFDAAQVDAFACSHTCLPVFDTLGGDTQWVLNNGAAGMPNFAGDSAGLLTRIATRPCRGGQRVYGLRCGELHVDALRIEHDSAQWQQQFLAQWPAGSDAHLSYWERIQRGPNYERAAALRQG
jgi:hypothetical protein